MAFILADRVKETTVTSGTGSVTLGNGFGAFQTFADAVGDGNQTYYAIENDVRWEVGIGTYTAATNSLARDTVLRSSNSGSLISLDGVSIVFATYPADKAVAFGITNYLPDGMPLTLGRTSAGNFIHAYVDNDSDETVALHMTNESTPTWKLGLKGSPSSNTSAPTYAYVYGTTGKAGLYAASDAYVFVDSNLGFYVSHESSNLLKITKDDGSVFTNASANVNGLTIKAASAQSYPIQVWADSAGNTLSAVRENGYFAVNKSSASYPLDVNGTASMTTLRFADGSTQTTSSRSSTDFASLSGIVNSKASQTELNAVSGLTLSGGTDTTYTAGSGLTLSGTTFHSSGWTVADGSGNSEAILDGQSIYFSGAGATSVTYNDSTNIVTVSGSLAAHPSVSAASSSDNSGRTYIQDITLDSNGHITGLATATETVTDTTTTYYPGSGLTVDGTTFNVSGANTSTIGIVELTNTIDSLQTKALTPKAVNDAGFLTSHPSISAGSTSNNSGRTYIQDITLDAYGHVTALGTAAETVTDTTYTAGHGLVLDGTSFNATALLTNIEGSGFSTSDTTYSAGTGLALSGTTFNASGASLSHSGVILTANIIDSNSGVAATPYAITQWAGSGLPGIDGSVISTLTEVTSADADMVMIWDADDSALKRVDAGEFRGGGGTTYTAGNGLLLDGTVFNASGASLSHSGVIKTSNTVDSNSGVAITPYAVKAVLTNIEASGFVTTDTNTTYTAGNGLILNGTTFNASGASLSHSGVIRISNTVDNNSGVAITPLAINDVLSNIESSGYLTASSTDTLTNKSIVATQLTGTIASARLPDLDVDDFAAATIQTGGEAFADSDTVLMTAAAVYNQIEAHSGTLNTAINTKQNTVTAGSGLIFSGATLNASGASLSHSGVIRTANIIDSNSGVAATPYAITQWAGSGLPGIDGSLISTLTEVTSADADMVMIWDADDSALKRVDAGEFRGGGGTTYTAGNGLLLDGTVFNASGASLSHSGVIKTSNTVDSNSGVAITPYAIKAVLTNIEGSGYITTDNNTTYTAGHGLALAGTSFSATALLTNIEGSGYIQDDSTDTLTNKSIVATQLTGTIASARLPDLAVSDFGAAAIQTGSESFADSDTVLMTAAAVYNQIEAHSGTLNTAINTKQNTVTAGSGLIFSGATLNASGASLSHPGVIRTSNTVDSNSGVAITPYAVKAVLTNIEGSGFIQADSTDTLTNKSIVATQLTGTIASDRLPDLAVSDFAGAAIQTGSESFADSDTALMTAGAVYNQIEAHSGTLNAALTTALTNIEGSGYITTDNNTTYTAGHGLALAGTSFSATALLTNIEGSGYIQDDSTDTLTNKSIVATQLTGTIASARLPDLAVSDFGAAAIQTGSESFADSDTVLMTAAAVYNQIEAHSGTLNTAINTKQNTVTAGSGLIFSGATLNASGASLSHPGVIRTSNTVDSNSGVAITPYAVKAVLTNIEGSGFIQADSTDTLTNKSIVATQLTGTIASDRLPDLAVSDFAGAAIQTGSESFADSDTALMTAGAVYNQIEAHSGTLNTAIGTKHDTIDASNRLNASLIGANGDVSNAEFGYLSTVSSDIQTQINTKQATMSAGHGLALDGTSFNATALLTNIEGSGYITTDTNTTYTAGHGLALVGTSFNATALLTNIEGSGYITASSTDTLTNKTLTSPDINGGTLDGATIGVSSHTTGKFTTVDATTDFTIGGTVITNNTITDDGTLIIAAATATSFSDGNITNVGDIAIDSISADGSAITISPPTTFSKSIIQPSGAITQSSSAITVDWSAGNFFTANLTATLDTVQFQNVTVGQRILLRLNQPGAAQTWTNNDSDAFRGSTATGTSNADVRWAGGGTPPTITAGTNTGDLFGFICIAEAVYDGFVVGQDIK